MFVDTTDLDIRQSHRVDFDTKTFRVNGRETYFILRLRLRELELKDRVVSILFERANKVKIVVSFIGFDPTREMSESGVFASWTHQWEVAPIVVFLIR